MKNKKQFYQNQAESLIKAFNKRQIVGHYCNDKNEALKKLNDLIPEKSTVSWGGSMTLGEIGAFESLYRRDLTLYDRGVSDPEERTEAEQKGHFADYYLMSSNAITLDGKLINIDGLGNRVAALIHGPKHVIIVAGMNKVCTSEKEAINRVRNFVAPANTLRLSRKTPCSVNGMCGDCLADDSICSHMVITRRSAFKERIHVILVGEVLGY